MDAEIRECLDAWQRVSASFAADAFDSVGHLIFMRGRFPDCNWPLRFFGPAMLLGLLGFAHDRNIRNLVTGALALVGPPNVARKQHFNGGR